jgi:hypothetical protein
VCSVPAVEFGAGSVGSHEAYVDLYVHGGMFL